MPNPLRVLEQSRRLPLVAGAGAELRKDGCPKTFRSKYLKKFKFLHKYARK